MQKYWRILNARSTVTVISGRQTNHQITSVELLVEVIQSRPPHRAGQRNENYIS